ncbi:MAG TPA: Gfo/Idh/MocA family oxidoreductase [Micromonosporaceae bacterium]|nr:Gfo/Idh/MocA family oxidoreductase [Micromonosporaceae bacterium]
MAGTIRFGVVGCGLIAHLAHLPSLRSIPAVEVSAVCDADPYRMRLARDVFQVPTGTTDALELLALDTVDAVVVATDDVSHAEVVVAALAAGKHVFVEKPLCLSLAEAKLVRNAEEASGRVVAVGYQRVHDTASQWLCQRIPAGEPPMTIWARNQCHDNMLVIAETAPAYLLDEAFRRGAAAAGDGDGDGRWQRLLDTGLARHGHRMSTVYRTFLNLACHDVSHVIHCFGEPSRVLFADFWNEQFPSAVVVYELPGGGRWVLEMGQTERKWFDSALSVTYPRQTLELRWPSPFRRDGRTVATVRATMGPGSAYQTSTFEAEAFPAYRRELAAFAAAVREATPPAAPPSVPRPAAPPSVPRPASPSPAVASVSHAEAVLRWQVAALRWYEDS